MTTVEQDVRQEVVDRLVAAFDYHDPGYTPETAEIVNGRLRDESPVAYTPAHGGMWVVSRYDDVKAMLRDHETFSSASGVHFPRADGMPMFSPIDYDLPEQARLRRIMAPPMKKQAIADLQASVRTLASDLIAPVAARGHGDLVAELSQPFAIGALGRAIGLSDRTQHEIREMTATMWRYLSTERDARGFWLRYRPVLADEIRRAREEPGDHYLSWLARTEFDGGRLSEELLYSIIISYCVAGHANTMNTINRILWCLGRDPELQRRVRHEPALAPIVADEVLRRWCPTDRFSRVTTRDVTIRGVTIPRGSRVVMLFDAANRDPERFPEPDEFSLDRPDSHGHLTYGHGIHRCLGEHFARMEFTAVLAALVEYPPFHLVDDVPVRFDNGRHLLFDTLEVEFDGAGS